MELKKRIQTIKSKPFKEMQGDCALWLLEIFDSIQPEDPPFKTASIMEFDGMRKGNRFKPEFYKEDPKGREVLGYINELVHSYFYNWGKLKQLITLSQFIKDNEIAYKAYQEKIGVFKDKVEECWRIWQEYLPFEPHKDEEQDKEEKEVRQALKNAGLV